VTKHRNLVYTIAVNSKMLIGHKPIKFTEPKVTVISLTFGTPDVLATT
jgi:hypothetical protein